MNIPSSVSDELIIRPANHRKPQLKPIHGIILLDKPTQMSSNAALQKVKKMLKARKAGHTGSLDPLASGMLPLCLGEATKFSQFLLDANKHYFVVTKLGIKTATGDAEGDIVEQRDPNCFDQAKLQAVLQSFRGDIEQIPSMYSALKHHGKPLYKLARKGIEVERKPRTVTISELTLVDQKPDSLTLDIRASKGTYIRTLIEDIGSALGTCAHVVYLRRLSVGPYQEQQMVTMQQIQKVIERDELSSILLTTDSAVAHWPKVTLSKAAHFYLQRGQAVRIANAPTTGWVRLHDQNDRFLGVGEMNSHGQVAPKRLCKSVRCNAK